MGGGSTMVLCLRRAAARQEQTVGGRTRIFDDVTKQQMGFSILDLSFVGSRFLHDDL